MYKVSPDGNELILKKDGTMAVFNKESGCKFPEGSAFISLGAAALFEKILMVEKNSPVLLIEPDIEMQKAAAGFGLENITYADNSGGAAIKEFLKKAGLKKCANIRIIRNRDAYISAGSFYKEALAAVNSALTEEKKSGEIRSIEELREASKRASGLEKEVFELMLLVYSVE
ncbi:MAG: hypothetical protein ABSA34_04830 [Candidatus Goldiibacteriota bacterium]